MIEDRIKFTEYPGNRMYNDSSGDTHTSTTITGTLKITYSYDAHDYILKQTENSINSYKRQICNHIKTNLYGDIEETIRAQTRRLQKLVGVDDCVINDIIEKLNESIESI